MALAYPYILFDLGNTLIYFEGHWQQVINEMNIALVDALCDMGYRLDRQTFADTFSTRSEAYYQQRDEDYIEHSTYEVLRQLMSEIQARDPDPTHLREAIRKMYLVSQAHWHLEQDTIDCLETLMASGHRLGIISNAGDDTDVQTLIDKAGIRAYFDIIVTSAAFGVRKPGRKIFQFALDHWQARPEQAMMVGDTLGADILGANQMGIASVWIRRRVDTIENRELAKSIRPWAVIDKLSELLTLLN